MAACVSVIELQQKPIPGMGDPPMLRYGYAKNEFWFSFMNLTLLSNWLCSAVWVIVGNADPKTLPHNPAEPAEVGNATAAASLSVAEAVSLEKAVSEPLWDIIGMPHDMGTSDAHAGSADSPITMTVRTAKINIFFKVLPSSILGDKKDER